MSADTLVLQTPALPPTLVPPPALNESASRAVPVPLLPETIHCPRPAKITLPLATINPPTTVVQLICQVLGIKFLNFCVSGNNEWYWTPLPNIADAVRAIEKRGRDAEHCDLVDPCIIPFTTLEVPAWQTVPEAEAEADRAVIYQVYKSFGISLMDVMGTNRNGDPTRFTVLRPDAGRQQCTVPLNAGPIGLTDAQCYTGLYFESFYPHIPEVVTTLAKLFSLSVICTQTPNAPVSLIFELPSTPKTLKVLNGSLLPSV